MPFEIGEYAPTSEINRLCAMVEESEGSPIYRELSEIQGYWFDSLEELLKNQDDIICYADCEDMKDVPPLLCIIEIDEKVRKYLL